MTFGERVKELRLKKGLTQRELGERMGGITQQTIAQYEKIVEQPKLVTIRKIANALDVKLYELVIDWSQFSPEELKEDFTNTDGNFYGKEASPEEQQKFMDRLFNGKNEASNKRKALDKKIDQFNDDGIQKISDYADDIMKIPEYRKDTE
ncbi:MAG: helix-turn-helix domain-containing protein [Blautia sp.]